MAAFFSVLLKIQYFRGHLLLWGWWFWNERKWGSWVSSMSMMSSSFLPPLSIPYVCGVCVNFTPSANHWWIETRKKFLRQFLLLFDDDDLRIMIIVAWGREEEEEVKKFVPVFNLFFPSFDSFLGKNKLLFEPLIIFTLPRSFARIHHFIVI